MEEELGFMRTFFFKSIQLFYHKQCIRARRNFRKRDASIAKTNIFGPIKSKRYDEDRTQKQILFQRLLDA